MQNKLKQLKQRQGKKEHLLNDRRQSSHETTIILVYHITAYSKDSGADEKIHRDIEISKLRLGGFNRLIIEHCLKNQNT